jgi:putative redox protein
MAMIVTFPGGKRVDAQYKGFTIHTDQSKSSGGEGTAPAPFDLFLASIGTCAGLYVLAFCQERSIPTEGAQLVMEAERNPQSRLYGKITIDIVLPPEFPKKYAEAVKAAANLCTVKKHLANPPEFDMRVKIG